MRSIAPCPLLVEKKLREASFSKSNTKKNSLCDLPTWCHNNKCMLVKISHPINIQPQSRKRIRMQVKLLLLQSWRIITQIHRLEWTWSHPPNFNWLRRALVVLSKIYLESLHSPRTSWACLKVHSWRRRRASIRTQQATTIRWLQQTQGPILDRVNIKVLRYQAHHRTSPWTKS